MASVQDTIGAAIADVIATFTTGTFAAEYGVDWGATAQHAEKGRVLVTPTGAAYSEGRSYATERLVEFLFSARFQLPGRGTKAADFAGIVGELRSKFAPESRTLQAAVAVLGGSYQPTRATVIARVDDPVVDGQEMTGKPDFNNFTVTIRAETFVTL